MGRQVTNVPPAAQEPGSSSPAVLSLAAALLRWGPASRPTAFQEEMQVGTGTATVETGASVTCRSPDLHQAPALVNRRPPPLQGTPNGHSDNGAFQSTEC